VRLVALRASPLAALLAMVSCTLGAGQDGLIGRWTNHHRAAKRPAIVSIEFFPKNTLTITTIDALGAAGWHPQSASTGQYEVIASGKLKLTEAAGAAVVDYRFERGRLVLSGDGLAQILGTATAPQALDQGD
jgi:hypothetical protein